MLTRQQLRQHFNDKRLALSANDQKSAAQRLVQNIQQVPSFKRSQSLAGYIAIAGELNPQLVLDLAWQQHKTCALPVLDPRDPHQLCFIRHSPQDKLTLNRYKIPEPKFDPEKIIPSTHLDLILVPLVAFDLQGNRLGRGAGYYDKTFAFLLQQVRPAKPYLLGVGYSWQTVPQLPIEPWDVPLDGMVTEHDFYDFRK